MTKPINKAETPEEIELNKKRAELLAFETDLAQNELDIAILNFYNDNTTYSYYGSEVHSPNL